MMFFRTDRERMMMLMISNHRNKCEYKMLNGKEPHNESDFWTQKPKRRRTHRTFAFSFPPEISDVTAQLTITNSFSLLFSIHFAQTILLYVFRFFFFLCLAHNRIVYKFFWFANSTHDNRKTAFNISTVDFCQSIYRCWWMHKTFFFLHYQQNIPSIPRWFSPP